MKRPYLSLSYDTVKHLEFQKELIKACKMALPFFHYTILENLDNIIQSKAIRARKYLTSNTYRDISIDPPQILRTKYALINYIPLYAGFHSFYRGYAFNGYLMCNYEPLRFVNIRFFGSLSKNLRTEVLKDDYEKVVILMIKTNTVLNFADKGKIKLFSDIAIKNDSKEITVTNRKELVGSIIDNINDQNQTCCEVDMLDDGNELIRFPEDLEALIVDNMNIGRVVEEKVAGAFGTEILKRLPIFQSELPRKDVKEEPIAKSE